MVRKLRIKIYENVLHYLTIYCNIVYEKEVQQMDKLYNITKASELLGVTRDTIYRWKKEGKISFVKVGDFNKVSESEIRRLRGE